MRYSPGECPYCFGLIDYGEGAVYKRDPDTYSVPFTLTQRMCDVIVITLVILACIASVLAFVYDIHGETLF